MVDIRYHLASLNQRLNPKLKRLWVETTDLCNSRCKTCFIWKNKNSQRRIDYAVLGNPLFKNVDYILNSGGEPSLCNLKSILLTEHKLLPKATLQVSTNGLLPQKILEAVGSVLEAGAKVDVGISLDGIGELHDMFRGVPGNFEKVDALVQGLSCLQRDFCCLRVTVGSTLTYETAKHADDLLNYVKCNNLEFIWHWPNKSSFYRNQDTPFDNCGDKDLLKEAINKAFSEGSYRQSWLDSLNGVSPCFECYALRGFAVLRCNGDIVPCLSHWDTSIGNIMTHDPETVWNSEKANSVRQTVHECGHHGCLNSWGYRWSLNDAYFPLLKNALKKRLLK